MKNGKRCQRWVVGDGLCYSHAPNKGKTGADSPRAKHGLRADRKKQPLIPGGRKASGLPDRFHDSIMAAADDPNLTSLYDELLITEGRMVDLIKRLDQGESGELWKSLKMLKHEYEDASHADKPDILWAIFQTIERGAADYQAWMDLNFMIQQKERLIKSETQIMKDREMLIRADRVLLFIRAIVETVMRNVPDPEDQERIRVAIDRVLNLPEVTIDGGIT